MENYNGYHGSFTQPAVATDLFLSFVSDIDWVEVWNETNIIAGGDASRSFLWRRDMLPNSNYLSRVAAGVYDVVNVTTGGFVLTDKASVATFAPIAITNINAAGLVLTATTSGINVGDTVRLYSVSGVAVENGHQLEGIDHQVTAINAGVSFTLGYLPAIVDTGVLTTATYRKIAYDELYSPRTRTIINVVAATNTVVTSKDHGFYVGQRVRLVIPSLSGMLELNDKYATVLTIPTNNTFTIDVPTTGFTPFVLPTSSIAPFTPAQVIPVGNTAKSEYINNYEDGLVNIGKIGMTLRIGAALPGGVAGDTIRWKAGKSAAF